MRDYPNDKDWVAAVRYGVYSIAREDDRIAITGYKKDDSSYYLDHFPEWSQEFLPQSDADLLNATDIRKIMFDHRAEKPWAWKKHVPIGCSDWLVRHFLNTPVFDELVAMEAQNV